MMKLFYVLLMSWLLMPVSWAENKYEVQAMEQTDQCWFFKNLKVIEQDNMIMVKGRMTAASRFALPRGHIDVAAFGPDGNKLAETTTAYVPSSLTYRTKQKGGVRFSASFGQSFPAGTVFKVAFHEEALMEKKPAHSGNIAK
ncbi:MAG: hypothetical protein OQL06_12050 [Gammaproteobacteria bacterium]|nr:hypothetical protein [Gammaproteobacteria bacterium]